MTSKITYTKTDEAPALATYSLLPVIEKFASAAGISIEVRDISLAGRILAAFPDHLSPEQRSPDDLSELGVLCKHPSANIIKLPNISASVPQLKAAIAELQSQGFRIPNYPEDPKTEADQSVKSRYAKVLGSAVNPVLREGNSDRRVAGPVKAFAKKNPHSMGAWSRDSKTRVAHMSQGDFYSSEKSFTAPKAMDLRIEFRGSDGSTKILKEKVSLKLGEIVDAATMGLTPLKSFYASCIKAASQEKLLLSLHLKATMMKVSDPIMFGAAVTVFFGDLFERYKSQFQSLGVDPRNGLGDVFSKIKKLSQGEQDEVLSAIKGAIQNQCAIAMVDSEKGITNLHVPSDVIVDASMPAMIRASGKMWGPDGVLHDTIAMIPDRCYAGVFQATIDDCKKHGAFDPRTMGSVANVGLMAQKAEEYGSHDKTFQVDATGQVVVVASDGTVVFEHRVEAGDIWRMCQTKDVAVRDWVKLAVGRARATKSPAVFWLDPERAHDRELMAKVKLYLGECDTAGLEIKILSPVEATRLSLERIRKGQDTISVTGNVLRDYLTDLFPILELGTSAKMLSIVPLLDGGGLFETGAGGSAPKHVQQFMEENYLRWDSMGEFLALAVSLEDLGAKQKNSKALVLAQALDEANGLMLSENRSPARKVGELDNRGSHFYLALYWAESLARQNHDPDLKAKFAPLAKSLRTHADKILSELTAVQGKRVEIGGYYRPDPKLTERAMRPSACFSECLAQL